MAPRKKRGNSNALPPSESQLNSNSNPKISMKANVWIVFSNLFREKIESARVLDNSLPEKIWFKLQFAVGVNDVTRVLERMKPVTLPIVASLVLECDPAAPPKAKAAVLIAADSNPRWLTKHLPSLALLRNVPLIFLKDYKGASLRLGQLVKLKTAIAIGIKAKGNAINQLVDEILGANSRGHLGTEFLDS